MSSISTRSGPGHRRGKRGHHGNAAGRVPHATIIAARHWPWLALLLALASVAGQTQPLAQPLAQSGPQAPAGSPASILFESTAVPATEPGGGLSVTSTSFPGHTFRLTERAHVTALGSRLIGLTGRSVFAALYQLDTTHTPPDVTTDSTLLATTLLTPASTAIADVSGAVDLILEPGWYAIVLGLDRHGATATNHQVSLATTGMPVTPMSRGTYSVNPTTGATTTHQARFRLFVSGHWLPPAAVPPQAFMIESARPWAWTSGGTSINASQTYAMHFRLDGNTRIEQLDTWLMNASGTLYGAIFPLAGSWARPPLPNSAGFADQAVASTLFAGGPGFHRASAQFDGALLPRGDYALVIGTGHFGATGSATILRAEDQVTGVSMFLYPGSGPVWFNHEANAMMRLSGTSPDLIGDTEMQFGPTLIGEQESRLLTLHNQNPDPDQYLALTISLAGTDSGQFGLIDAAACDILPPSATCQMTVTYQPDHVAGGDGDHHATLVLEHNGQPELLIGLTGTALASAWVTPVPAAHGSIIPDTAQRVGIGTTFEFQLQPAANHHVASVGGTCTGSLDGNVYTTAPVQADCTVAPVFAIDTFQISASASGNGAISPAGTITVEHGDTPSFTVTAATGHHLAGISGSCTGTLAGNVFTLAPVTADCALHASFAIDTFQISASAGDNGSINPAGAITIDYGDTPSFTVTPDTGHHLAEVTGSCTGTLAGNVFTLAPVTADCALHASFAIDTFQINVSAGDNGAINPDGTITVDYGDTPSFTVTPDTGHHLDEVTGTCTGTLVGDVYTLEPVSADCALHASFAIDTFQISASAGDNGSINPEGTITVDYGDTPSFTVTPDTGHHLDEVTGSCTGTLVGDVYTLEPISADCALHASFAIDTFQISASAGDNGAINPDGAITVDYGDTPSFTITPDTGHHLDEVTGSCTGTLAGDVYTLEPVSADCALHASFVLAPATLLTIISGSGQSTPVNAAFAEPLVLRVSNDAGLPVPGIQVHFQVPANGAGLLPPAHATSNDQGEVIVTVTANNALGSYPVQAGAEDLAPVVFQLTNLAPAVSLKLDIDNGLPHLAYGSPAAYLVSLRNTGQDPALKARVLVPLPAQLDPQQAEWFCLDPDSGCQASGTGALDEDGLVLAAGSRVQYLLSAPVRLDATGEEVVIEAYAEAEHHPPVSASSHSWLVLFRDGFQLPPGSEPVSGQQSQ